MQLSKAEMLRVCLAPEDCEVSRVLHGAVGCQFHGDDCNGLALWVT